MNRKIMVALAATALTFSLPAMAQKAKSYGKTFKAASVKTPEQVVKAMAGKSTMTKVAIKGEIAQVCQAEGCWLKLKNAGGEDIFVKMKDHAFFVPKDIAGKTAVVYGDVIKKTVSVAEQRHLAEDAGASETDMNAITQPKDEVRIEAAGVVVN